jgi:hypothetical protein
VSENVQEVRIVLDMSITLSTRYEAKEVREIVERGAFLAFRNNPTIIHDLKFAEEHAIYKQGNDAEPEWTAIYDGGKRL